MTAIAYQFMPPLSAEEYTALEQSIRENGIQVPVVLDEEGRVVDGHHRQKIASELGIECPSRTVTGKSDAELHTLALSLNLDRRHLSREQRRNLVAASLKADPQLSNREHAQRTGVDHKTVAAVRAPMQSTGEIPQLDKTLGADGRTRPAAITRTTTQREVIDTTTGEITPSHGTHKPRRKPITDAFWEARMALEQRLETLARLASDDRMPANKQKVAETNLHYLKHCRDLLQQVIDQITD